MLQNALTYFLAYLTLSWSSILRKKYFPEELKTYIRVKGATEIAKDLKSLEIKHKSILQNLLKCLIAHF